VAGGRAYERNCAVAQMHGRPVACSITSMAAPRPHPPKSAPVPEIRPGATSICHTCASLVRSSPKKVTASIGAGGYRRAPIPLGGARAHDSSPTRRAKKTRSNPPCCQEVLMRASVHLADVGVGAALASARKPPAAGSIAGLRNAEVGLAAPLRPSLLPRPQLG